jgi:hypothetical protein
MALTADRPETEVATDDDLREAVRAALQRVGMTFEDLEREAHAGRFSSDRARLTWVAICDLADYR